MLYVEEKFDPTAKPLSFSNGVKAYINKGTNLLVLATWLLHKGCLLNEMPEPMRQVAKKYLARMAVVDARVAQKVSIAVQCELEGMKPSEIAKRLRITTKAYLAFRAKNKHRFIAEFDRIATDARVQAVATFLDAERRMTTTMPKAAQAIDEIISNDDTPPAVRSRTALELLKIMRATSIQDRIADLDNAFGAIAYDTAMIDPILTPQEECEVTGEFLPSGHEPPTAGDADEAANGAPVDCVAPESEDVVRSM